MAAARTKADAASIAASRGTSFSAQIKKWSDLLESELELWARLVVFELYTRIIMDTPVDTGVARGNWNPSTDIPDLSVDYAKKDPTGRDTVAKLQALVFSVNFDDVQSYRLTNNVHYAHLLEGGYSDKSPLGMVYKNLQSFDEISFEVMREVGLA